MAPVVVGEPPAHFTETERAAWYELAPQVEGVFTRSDRTSFCLLVKQWALLEGDAATWSPSARARQAQLVNALLQGFGLSPASRGRVQQVRSVTPAEKAERKARDEDEYFFFEKPKELLARFAARPPHLPH